MSSRSEHANWKLAKAIAGNTGVLAESQLLSDLASGLPSFRPGEIIARTANNLKRAGAALMLTATSILGTPSLPATASNPESRGPIELGCDLETSTYNPAVPNIDVGGRGSLTILASQRKNGGVEDMPNLVIVPVIDGSEPNYQPFDSGITTVARFVPEKKGADCEPEIDSGNWARAIPKLLENLGQKSGSDYQIFVAGTELKDGKKRLSGKLIQIPPPIIPHAIPIKEAGSASTKTGGAGGGGKAVATQVGEPDCTAEFFGTSMVVDNPVDEEGKDTQEVILEEFKTRNPDKTYRGVGVREDTEYKYKHSAWNGANMQTIIWKYNEARKKIPPVRAKTVISEFARNNFSNQVVDPATAKILAGQAIDLLTEGKDNGTVAVLVPTAVDPISASPIHGLDYNLPFIAAPLVGDVVKARQARLISEGSNVKLVYYPTLDFGEDMYMTNTNPITGKPEPGVHWNAKALRRIANTLMTLEPSVACGTAKISKTFLPIAVNNVVNPDSPITTPESPVITPTPQPEANTITQTMTVDTVYQATPFPASQWPRPSK